MLDIATILAHMSTTMQPPVTVAALMQAGQPAIDYGPISVIRRPVKITWAQVRQVMENEGWRLTREDSHLAKFSEDWQPSPKVVFQLWRKQPRGPLGRFKKGHSEYCVIVSATATTAPTTTSQQPSWRTWRKQK